jgi:hypothetical protein
VHEKTGIVLVRILVKVIDALCIKGRRTPFNAMDPVALGEEQLREISAILARHTGNQRDVL